MAGVTVAGVCRRLGMSRQNFYAQRKRRQRRQVDEELIVGLVLQEREQQPRLGTRKLQHRLGPELKRAGVQAGRDRLFEILRGRDLLLEPLRGEYPHTTQSEHNLPVFSNRVKELEESGPNQVWVADITYLRTAEGNLFLSLLTDRWSRKIVGYHCAESLESRGAQQTLEMALEELPAQARPIHHSDRGCQYCCHEYVERLQQRGLPISMTETDHCAENALAERVNGILKQEYGLGRELPSKAVARRAVAQAVRLYNNCRPHTALGYRTPAQVHGAGLN